MPDNLTTKKKRKKKKKSGKMSKQVILLKRVQEALGKEKYNHTKQNILGCKKYKWKSVCILMLKLPVMNWFEGYAC